MEETPKKIVRSDLVCFLCACCLNKDKVRVFGKSAVDIPGFIKSAIDIDAAVFSSSDLFVCTSCYKLHASLALLTMNEFANLFVFTRGVANFLCLLSSCEIERVHMNVVPRSTKNTNDETEN